MQCVTVRMPTPCSLDLRWRVVWFHTAHHLSATDISQQLCISERIVRRYIDMFEQLCISERIVRRYIDMFEQLCISERIVRRYIDMFEQTGEVLTIISAQMHNCIVV